MTEHIEQFRQIWSQANKEEKRQIFDIVWAHVEPACLNAKKLPPCPYERIKDLYHEILPSLPRVLILSDARKRHIKARWRQYPSLDLWRQYFQRVTESSFLMGQSASTGNRPPFSADFDWLIVESNMVKVIEGKYKR